MELTLDQALQKGVEAHKAGNVQEADRYYTAILKAQPKHPDANHNMGVLAVGVGKVQQALPFFKTALDANPNVAQYWLSYIDALIKLNQMDDAKAMFDKAKSNGAKGDGFDKLKERLETSVSKTPNMQEPPQDQLKPVIDLFNQAQHQKALIAAQQLLTTFPSSVTLFNIIGAAHQGLGQLDAAVDSFERALSIKPDYVEAYNNMGATLTDQGKPEKALKALKESLAIKPYNAEAHNKIGNALKTQGKLEEAIEAYNKALAIKPDYAQAYNNMGSAFKNKGMMKEAIEAFNKALSIKPDYTGAHNNMGNALKEQGRLSEAIEAYNKALSLKPDYAEAFYNMGNALKERGKLDEAIEAYNNAISINPNYAEAYNNIGITLQNQAKMKKAIEAYKTALSIKPDYAEAHINVGNALKEQGKLDEAIEAFKKAISIKPDFVEAYVNMGNVLQEQGKLKEAIETFNKVLSIKPDFADALWNLSGTATSLDEAKQWIEKCLKANPDHIQSKLTLSALQFYKGDKSEFNTLVKSSHKDSPYMRSFAWAFRLPELPPLYFHRWALFDQMVVLSKKNRPFYEFGVWRAEAFRYLIKTFKKGYGFDTFEGLPEDWHSEKAGTYSSDGNVPKVDGGEFIVGKFEDTLPEFFAKKRPKASIVNFDADLYSSTICALNYAKPVIDKHTILIFDEFIMNKHWEEDEYKALEEFCTKNHYTYEVLAISFFTKQVAVKIIGI
jgi:tetratricopeptide (TPR) repeat protein